MAADLLAALIGATLAASVAIALVLLLRRAAHRLFGAVAAYALWLIVPVAILASFLPARPAEVLPAPLRPAAEIAVHAAADWMAARAPAAVQASLIDSVALVLTIWAIGFVACAILLLGAQRRTIRRFGELVEDRSGDLSILRAATNDAGPAVIGGFKPRLVLPYDFETRFSPAEQTLILAHEGAHIAFNDPKVNWLIALILCLNWFNPLVHLGATRARVDQELACDAAVVARHPGERRAYAEALLKSQLAPASLPLGCYWPVRSPRLLKERIEMLANQSPTLARRLAGTVAVAALSGLAAYGAWAAAPVQERLIEAPVLAQLKTPPAIRTEAPSPAEARRAASAMQEICLTNACTERRAVAPNGFPTTQAEFEAAIAEGEAFLDEGLREYANLSPEMRTAMDEALAQYEAERQFTRPKTIADAIKAGDVMAIAELGGTQGESMRAQIVQAEMHGDAREADKARAALVRFSPADLNRPTSPIVSFGGSVAEVEKSLLQQKADLRSQMEELRAQVQARATGAASKP